MDTPEKLTGFGASVKRKEDPAFLRGEGQYIDDLHLPNMLHASFVRSPYAHACIGKIDKSADPSYLQSELKKRREELFKCCHNDIY